jgi:hypothetical protein
VPGGAACALVAPLGAFRLLGAFSISLPMGRLTLRLTLGFTLGQWFEMLVTHGSSSPKATRCSWLEAIR